MRIDSSRRETWGRHFVAKANAVSHWTMRFLAALVVLSACGGYAHAVSHTGISACLDPNAEPRASSEACTAAINSGALDQGHLAAAHFSRAFRETRLKIFDRALLDCDAVVALRPDDFQGYDCRGWTHAEMAKFDLAIADYGQALRLNPSDFTALYNRARAFTMKNEFASSIPDYDRAIKADPSKFMGWNGRCWARDVIGKDLDAALSDCDEAVKLAPADANNYNSRGFGFFRKQRYADAIKDYDKAISLDPDAASSYYMRGLAKLATGDASGSVDIERGESMEAGIATRYAGYGIKGKR